MTGSDSLPGHSVDGMMDEELLVVVDELMSRTPPSAAMFSMLDPTLRPALAWGALNHPDPPARRLCLDYLDHMAGPDAAATFVAALADPVPRVRRHAIHALTCEACKPEPLCVDAVAPLRQVVAADPNPKVRFEALRALLGQLDPLQRAAAIEDVVDRGDRSLLAEVLHARPRSLPAELRARAQQADTQQSKSDHF